MNALSVWMNGERVATWTLRSGTHTLRYEPSWLVSERRRSLSLSLPIGPSLTITGAVVKSYFDNLLPDNDDIRERLRRRYGAASREAFDLLTAIGRDCVGAVQLLPEDADTPDVRRLEHTPLGEAAIEAHLDAMLTGAPLGSAEQDDGGFRISIAGAQEKSALLRVGKRWCMPHGATPTTHILKLPLGLVGGMQYDMRDSVENEWLCMHLLAAMGLPTAACEIARFGRHKVLVVERFDRQWQDQGTWIARIPQEDFCQATGKPPGAKYEADRGPGIDACMRLLGGSAAADRDRALFLLSQLAFWLLGATDGHAKNFSLFLHAADSYRMTPLYDVLSAWPITGTGRGRIAPHNLRLAMAVRASNAHYHLAEIQTRHWFALDERYNTGLSDALAEWVGQVPQAIEQVQALLPAGFPEPVWTAVTTQLRAQAQRFLRGLQKA